MNKKKTKEDFIDFLKNKLSRSDMNRKERRKELKQIKAFHKKKLKVKV